MNRRVLQSMPLLVLPVVLPACSPCAAPVPAALPSIPAPCLIAPAATSVASPRPPVLVTVVVDQLAAWVAADRLLQLPERGGLRRLMSEGTTVREARLAHAVTDTAPGHAAIYSGAPPQVSGITTNEQIYPTTKSSVSIYYDPSVNLVGPKGPFDSIGSSALRLNAPTLADELREQHASAVIISLSIKDRGTIPGGGRHPNAALWFDSVTDQMVTSTAFAASLPEWALPAASSEALARARREPWVPLDAAWLMEHAETPDDQPGEGAWPGLGMVFPHDFNQAVSPAKAFRGSPYADTVLLDLAKRAVESPDFGKEPTLLALSLSANDYVGHLSGPHSWEAWDLLLRLDAGLSELFGVLDARLGSDGYAVLLTADHGVAPLPETAGDMRVRPWCALDSEDRWERPCTQGGRLIGSETENELRRAAKAALGAGDWVLGIAEPYVVLSDAAHRLPAQLYDQLVAALRALLERHAEVARAIDTRAIAKECPGVTDESIDALVCRSYAPPAGDIYIVTAPGSFFDPGYSPNTGTSHGTPYRYDRSIPILARSPGRVAAGKVIDEPQSFATFTRTGAALLSINAPRACVEGRDLTQSDSNGEP